MRQLQLEELNRLSTDAYRDAPKAPLVLVLDNIRSGLNVGSAFRTADAFRLERIVLCGICCIPPHREILKTALGATDTVDWQHHENTVETIRKLQEDGYTVVAVELTNQSTSLEKWTVNRNSKYALVLGNEVEGVQPDVLQQVDEAIEIPQFGTKHSLNVSVCMGIVVWEWFRQHQLNGHGK